MKPYTYLIGWTDHNIWYYGCQYGPSANPVNLWTKYFTSSKRVKSFCKEHGEPDVIMVRKIFESPDAAVRWENEVIRRLNAITQTKWLNQSIGGEKFYRTGPHDQPTKEKMRAASLGKPKTAQHKLNMSKANLGTKKGPASEERKRKIGDANRGKKRSEEWRKQQSKLLRGMNLKHPNRKRPAPWSEERRKNWSEAVRLKWIERKKRACGTIF